MKKPFSKTLSVLILSIVLFIDRFCYYGCRAILVLYVTAKNGLNMEASEVLPIYAYFTAGVVVMTLVSGILIDRFFEKKRALILGYLFLVVGYGLILTGHMYGVISALCLLVIGQSIVRPTAFVLTAGLFNKTDRSRRFAFLFLFCIVNIAAFLGVVLCGYVGETINWMYSFGIIALLTLIGALMFVLTHRRIDLIETNDVFTPNLTYESSNFVLKKLSYKLIGLSSLLILFLVSTTVALYDEFYAILGIDMSSVFYDNPDMISDLLNYNIWIINIVGILSLIIPTLLIVVFWFRTGLKSSVRTMSLSFLIFGFAAALVPIFPMTDYSFLFKVAIFLVISFSGALLSATAVSYLTRLSDVRYNSTIYAFYLLVVFGVSAVFQVLQRLDWVPSNALISLIAIMIGVVMWISRDQLSKFSNGLD